MTLDINQIDGHISKLIADMAAHKVYHQPSAYASAAVAWLSKYYPGYGFEKAIEWVLNNQNGDGSWGTQSIVHHHERVLSTMYSLIALKETDKLTDDLYKSGIGYVESAVQKLSEDKHDTASFHFVLPSLLSIAAKIGLDVSTVKYTLQPKWEHVLQKALKHPELFLNTKLVHTIDSLVPEIVETNPNFYITTDHPLIAGFVATTAVYLIYCRNDPKKEERLRAIQEYVLENGIVGSIDAPLTDYSFGCDFLLDCGLPAEEMRPVIKYLESQYDTKKGIGYNKDVPLQDMDDTVATFRLMNELDTNQDDSIFDQYETEEHFICFPEESLTDSSKSVNMRLYQALRRRHNQGIVTERSTRWLAKLEKYLRLNDVSAWEKPDFQDKWHTSPYYLIPKFMLMWAEDKNQQIMSSVVNYLKSEQRPDGGFGYSSSNIEESSFGLHAYLIYQQTFGGGCTEEIERCYQYFVANYTPGSNVPDLWIAKTLFGSYYMAHANILGVLNKYRSVMLKKSVKEQEDHTCGTDNVLESSEEEWMALSNESIRKVVEPLNMSIYVSEPATQRSFWIHKMNTLGIDKNTKAVNLWKDVASTTDYVEFSAKAYATMFDYYFSLGAKHVATMLIVPSQTRRSDTYNEKTQQFADYYICHPLFDALCKKHKVVTMKFGAHADNSPHGYTQALIGAVNKRFEATKHYLADKDHKVLLLGISETTFSEGMIKFASNYTKETGEICTSEIYRKSQFPYGPEKLDIIVAGDVINNEVVCVPTIFDQDSTRIYKVVCSNMYITENMVKRILYDFLCKKKKRTHANDISIESLLETQQYWSKHKECMSGFADIVGGKTYLQHSC